MYSNARASARAEVLDLSVSVFNRKIGKVRSAAEALYHIVLGNNV